MTREAVLEEPTPDRFRVAMKASLWAWALYWPGGGLLLMLGGIDPISIGVTVAGVVGFILMMRMGALETDSSRTMKEFLLERPMYLVLVLAIFAFIAPFFGPIEDFGLRMFSLLYLGAITLAVVRLRQWMVESGKPVRASGADQVYIVLGIAGFAAMLVFLDAWLPMFGAETTPANSMTVAAANWTSLLYPPLLLLAAKPFRSVLRNPFRTPAEDSEAPVATKVKMTMNT